MQIYHNNEIGALLRANEYPGRGIVIGKTPDGTRAAVAYFIMGRSENSQNRVFAEKGDDVVIYPFDESKVEDPSLIIYSPIRKLGDRLIVTNGDQTDTIYDFVKKGKGMAAALKTRCFEPDAPNFTPRISGMLTFEDGDFSYEMSILKSADERGSACNRYAFCYAALAGLGHFLHTYHENGNPIPTFTGEPERIAMLNDIDLFTKTIWENLNERFKISLYVRFLDLKNGNVENRMVNKNK